MIDSTTGNLAIKNGELQIGNTDEQDIEIVLTANKGEFKHEPVLGAGLVNYLHSLGREREMLRQVKIQLELAGYPNAKARIEDRKLIIE
jgi:hypothetical protein